MAGNKLGGQRAAQTNKERFGQDFYKKIGKQGGSKGAKDGVLKGFARMTPKKRSDAGKKGGAISRRGKAKVVATYKVTMVPHITVEPVETPRTSLINKLRRLF